MSRRSHVARVFTPLSDSEYDLEQDGSTEMDSDDGGGEKEVPVGADAYGGVVFAAVRLFDADSLKQKGQCQLATNFVISFFMHGINLFFQFGLLFLIFAFAIENSEDPWEHADLTAEGAVLDAAMAAVPPQPLDATIALNALAVNRCRKDHTVRFAQSFLIFLWAVRVTPEVMGCFWTTKTCWSLPDTKMGKLIKETDGKFFIFSLNLRLRIFISLFVNLPKFLIGVLLAFVGAKFLMFANSLAPLVMKAVAMQFVLTIDELIFNGLASAAYAKQVSDCCFLIYQDTIPVNWNLWGTTVLKFFVIVAWTLAITRVMYADVQSFRDSCSFYEGAFPAPGNHTGLSFLGMRFIE